MRRRSLGHDKVLGEERHPVISDFDLTGISRFEFGPYWRIASPAERREFSDLFAIAPFTSMGDGSRNPAMGVSS
jgi:hypothetical protein